ncbi:MAG: type II secretion system major pseudopilin GspG [Gammaproteobacteria bacterium]|nr:type II secretion system major pseudopilin GspG [Gammaproteobacteria bacterium]
MVVVMIIGLMAAVVVPKLMNRPDQARLTKAKVDMQTIKQALEQYRLDNYRYPNTDQGIQALVTKPTTGPEAANWNEGGYLEKVPKDPWKNEYLYLQPGEHGDVDIFTYGADVRPGGEGMDADIGSWDLDK